jgi:hypothetical protein
VLENVRTCVECGIEKVFLINHVVTVGDLLKCASLVKSSFPSLWVGVNMLGVPTVRALSMELPGVDGLWCDATITPDEASNRVFKGMFFGGVAFKYQPQPKDLQAACREAALATDVATTSGPGTGKMAEIEKIEDIHEYLAGHPMAIASGISAGNIKGYSGLADYLLVASSITNEKEYIIKEKLVELKDALRVEPVITTSNEQ